VCSEQSGHIARQQVNATGYGASTNWDSTILYNNWHDNVQNPTQAQGDLDGDHDGDVSDLDLMFAQYGLELDVVS